MGTAGASFGSDKLKTPCLLKEDEFKIGDAIVIYPEIISGNPLPAKYVVRYMLNREAYLSGQSMGAGENDFILSYSRAFLRGHHTLFIPAIDLSIFRCKGIYDRSQNMFWIGKGRIRDQKDIPHDSIQITKTWPETPEDLADKLCRTNFLYSFDFLSSINAEAVMCGATTVLLGQDNWTRHDLEFLELGAGGFAFGNSPQEIDRAMRSRHEQVERIRYYTATIRRNVLNFVDATQSYFKSMQ